MVGIFSSFKRLFRDNAPALVVYFVVSLLLMSMLLLPALKIIDIGTIVDWRFSSHYSVSPIAGLGASVYVFWIIYIFFVFPFQYGYLMAMLGQDNIGSIESFKACFSKYGRLLGVFTLYYVARTAISLIGGFALYIFLLLPLVFVYYFSTALTLALLIIIFLVVRFFYVYFIKSTFTVCVFEAFFSKDTVVKAIDNSFSKTGKQRTKMAVIIFCCDLAMLVLLGLTIVLAFFGFPYLPIIGAAVCLFAYPLLVMSLCYPVYLNYRKQFDATASTAPVTEQLANTNL